MEQDEERERRLRRAAFDALRRANRPTPILLPLALRRALECLYGSSVKAESEGPSAAAVDLDTVLAAVGSGGLVAPEQAAEGGCHELLSLLPPKAQLEIVQELVALLTKEGFGSGAVAAAVDGVMRSPGANPNSNPPSLNTDMPTVTLTRPPPTLLHRRAPGRHRLRNCCCWHHR